ncbi:MAG: glycosyl hydrolase family protein, partial [Chloroflexi bacterium]
LIIYLTLSGLPVQFDMFDIRETFENEPNPDLYRTALGNAHITQQPGQLWLTLRPGDKDRYSDAQIADYTGRDFISRPPLRMTLRAYASPGVDALRGTAGFGFWNHPFVPGETRIPHLPQALWFFFASPPSNIQLARGVPGYGWKAATFNAIQWRFFALLPIAPLGLLLMRIPVLYRHLWPVGQRAIGVSEYLLDNKLLNEPHTYAIEWREHSATFFIDDRIVYQARHNLRDSLGFIAWIDNQYAIVTPQGNLGFGLLPVEHEQSLVLESVFLQDLRDPEIC